MRSIQFYKKGKTMFIAAAVLCGTLTGSMLISQDTYAASKGIKIRYNKKTRINKSKRMKVKYKNKTVSKSSYKALIINKSYMVPYTDVFKSGIKATCKYVSKKKSLTITKNDVTIKMKVGSKTAYVNGKKTKLPAAPLSVRFVSKKKTKIVVPVSFVAKKLHLTYKKSGSSIYINDPLVLSYDKKTTYYTGAQGTVFYNHQNYPLKDMPVIKIGNSMYMPAEEVLDGIMNLDYDYNPSTGKLTVSNEDTNIELTAQLNSNAVTVNGKKAVLNAPLKLVKNVSANKEVLCVPASGLAKQLGYSRSWVKANSYYSIQSKLFFDWSNKLDEEKASVQEPNYIYAVKAGYTEQNGTGAINLNVTGSSSDLMHKLTVSRSSNIIKITMPQSEYLLNKNQFSNFGEIVQKMEITTSEDDTMTITLTCGNTTDYSYTIQNNTLVLNLLYTYSSSTGSVTNYSLSIPKPSGITLSHVTNQDLYASKKFQIDLKGDHVEFFRKNPVVINNNKVKSIAITKSGSNTRITVTTSSLRGYKIFDKGKNFVVSMDEPKKIYKSIVVLDPGHGGHDPGAQNKKKMKRT